MSGPRGVGPREGRLIVEYSERRFDQKRVDEGEGGWGVGKIKYSWKETGWEIGETWVDHMRLYRPDWESRQRRKPPHALAGTAEGERERKKPGSGVEGGKARKRYLKTH